ncbi:MAG: hypothetical protein K8T89_07145 [Planctomycetes bacterium]|nr:hypothetical protein [Planctomycetota bacterium]
MRIHKVWPGDAHFEIFRSLGEVAISPDGGHVVFAIKRPGAGGASVRLCKTMPWRELESFEFPKIDVCHIAPANGLCRVLFGFTKLIESPVLWTRTGIR